jgi:hypothetical protein
VSDDPDPPRPGRLSRRLPGVIQELLARGKLPPDTPGLAELEAELPEQWWAILWSQGPSEQQGWPLRRDVEIAARAAARAPSLPDPLDAWLDDVRGWLDGRVDAGAFAALHGLVSAMVLGGTVAGGEDSDPQALQIFGSLYPEAGEVERRAFLQARRQPPADVAVCFVVEATHAARDGWLAYHAHRGLAAPTAILAADAVARALAAGHVTGAEVVAWARELSRAPGG